MECVRHPWTVCPVLGAPVGYMREDQGAGVVIFPLGSIKAFKIILKYPVIFLSKALSKMLDFTTFLISKFIKKYVLFYQTNFIHF